MAYVKQACDGGFLLPAKNSIEFTSAAYHEKMTSSTSGETRVMVTHIPEEATDQQLDAMFGEIAQMRQPFRIVRHPWTSKSTGYGFGYFFTPFDAKAAVKALDGQLLSGKSLKVFLPDHDGQNNSALHLAGIPTEMTILAFRDYFSGVGELNSCKLLHPVKPECKTRSGFLRYGSWDDATYVMHQYNGWKLDGVHPLVISYVKGGTGAGPVARTTVAENGFHEVAVFIGNLDSGMWTQDSFRQLVANWDADVQSTFLMPSGTFGFANFKSASSAVDACMSLNGQPRGTGSRLLVELKKE